MAVRFPVYAEPGRSRVRIMIEKLSIQGEKGMVTEYLKTFLH